MSHDHATCAAPIAAADDHRYRRVLWTVLAVNAVMFIVETGAGAHAGSVALQADALDFLGDAANYGISLYVLARSLRWRASTALLKGATMIAFGIVILAITVWRAVILGVPSATIMGSIGLAALGANLLCTLLLFRFRAGDANRRSVWLCTRNDAIGNLAVIGAAGAVAATATPWPDLAVGAIMAGLAIFSGTHVVRQAAGELRHARFMVG